MTTLLGVRLAGRPVLVAGGGPVAARRVAALLAEQADVLVVAPQLCEDLVEAHRAARVRWRAGEVAASDLDGVWLVHTATGDRAVDDQVATWAQERRIWCVHAGHGAAGSAVTPALARHGEVVVGVTSATSADPSRSVAVRDAISGALGEGRLPVRRRRPGPGRVVLVGGGPGDPDLVTVAGRRALAEADVVVADRLGPTSLLADLGPGVEVVDVGKTAGHHPVPQHEINRLLVERARRGQVVVRLKGGDPYVYGRGGEEVLACAQAGVPVQVVPGVTSALSVPAAAGIPVTHRGTAGSVLLVSGHEGLTEAGRRAAPLLSVAGPGGLTLVVLMGVASLRGIAADALAHGAEPTTPVAVVEEGTTPRQRTTRADLATVAEVAQAAGVRAPAVLVIGAVAVPGLLEPGSAGR